MCNVNRDGDRLSQLLVFSEEFQARASYHLVLITPLPFVHTARRCYRLSDLANHSEIDMFSRFRVKLPTALQVPQRKSQHNTNYCKLRCASTK